MLQISNIKIKLSDKAISKAWLKLYQSLNVDPDKIVSNLPIDNEKNKKKIKIKKI